MLSPVLVALNFSDTGFPKSQKRQFSIGICQNGNFYAKKHAFLYVFNL
jgi:hypothetical protein